MHFETGRQGSFITSILRTQAGVRNDVGGRAFGSDFGRVGFVVELRSLGVELEFVEIEVKRPAAFGDRTEAGRCGGNRDGGEADEREQGGNGMGFHDTNAEPGNVPPAPRVALIDDRIGRCIQSLFRRFGRVGRI